MKCFSIKITPLIFISCLSVASASRKVTLTCGPDEESNRGFPGSPGKRGPVGLKGQKGEQGIKGEKGQHDDSREAISRLERRVNELEDQLIIANEAIAEQKIYRTSLQHILKSCDDLYELGFREDGVYYINPGGLLMMVYCEFENNGSNWLVMQKRQSGNIDFYRDFQAYTRPFGNLSDEFWWGLENIHIITTSSSHTLRVDLEDWEGVKRYAEYSSFSIGGSSTNYSINVNGYSGNAGDSLSYHNNQQFSTYDRDNDAHSSNCAEVYHGAWWHKSCHHSNLNGNYTRPSDFVYASGVVWNSFHGYVYSMKRAEMKIRPN